MIIKMNKYSFLIFHKEHKDFLTYLRDLGVVHISQNKDTKQIEEIKALIAEKKAVDSLLSRMEILRSTATSPEVQLPSSDKLPISLPPDLFTSSEAYRSAVEQVDTRKEQNNKELLRLSQIEDELSVWGDYDPDLLQKLAASGRELRFWVVPAAQYQSVWEEDHGAIIIKEERRMVYFVTVTFKGCAPQFSAEQLFPPMVSLMALRSEMDELKRQDTVLSDLLVQMAKDTSALEHYAAEIDDRYNFDNALLQGEQLFDDALVVLEGYIPTEQASQLEQALTTGGYAYTQLEITEDDNVPVKLKNNFFTRVFEPIVELFSLPNYHELDPTPLVAPFFMLFFAMCFGDAGYGLFLLAVCTFMKRKGKESLKPILSLFQWLAGAAVVVGFFSGSFFGVELAKIEALANIRHFFISSENMMVISIAIGFLQIIVAKYVAAYKIKMQKGLKHALSPFAWATFIVVMVAVFVVGLPQLSLNPPAYVNTFLYVLAGCCAAIFIFFNSPGKNIVVNVGSSLWTAYNVASGLLGDTLSYIRLFAIGLTGAILGNVFNTLAFSMSEGIPVPANWIVITLILLAGHAINFGLAMIGSLVHPIRLIFVEYFNNSNYEGGGSEYLPLRKTSSK